MRATIRLVIKQHRFELFAFGLLIGLALAASIYFLIVLAGLPIATCFTETTPSAACTAANDTYSTIGYPIQVLHWIAIPLTSVAAVFIGVSIVGREIERGTAVLIWSTTGNRVRWLLGQFAVVAVFIVVVASIYGLALDAINAIALPMVPLGRSLINYEFRGWLIPIRALVGLSAATFAGQPSAGSCPRCSSRSSAQRS